jgi:hypothetical protein
MNEVFQHALTYKSNQAIASIEVGKFGAIASEHTDAKGGFFLVKWKSTSYTLQEETEVFGGCGLMPAGTVVVDGSIYHHLQGNNNGWFQPPDYKGPNMPYDTIWVQHIAKELVVGKRSKPDPSNKNWPPFPSFISEHNNAFYRTGLLWLFPTQLEFIKTELQSREHLELYDLDGEEEDNTDNDVATINPTSSTNTAVPYITLYSYRYNYKGWNTLSNKPFTRWYRG